MTTRNTYIPAGAATASEFAAWLGISRNKVAELASDLGIVRLGRKYPWHATVARVLGIAADGRQIHGLIDAPLMTLAELAEEAGLAAGDLKAGLEAGTMILPPMYVLRKRRRRFLRSQCLQFLRSRTWEQYDQIPDHAATLEELALELGIAPAILQQHLEDDSKAVPAHVVADGVTRYIRAHALEVFGPYRVEPAIPLTRPAPRQRHPLCHHRPPAAFSDEQPRPQGSRQPLGSLLAALEGLFLPATTPTHIATGRQDGRQDRKREKQDELLLAEHRTIR